VGIRPEYRWWILTLAVVGVLLLISALALDRPNVIWEEGVPHCPQCRTAVPHFSKRCPTCTEPYDWNPARDEDCPVSRWSLSALEARYLHERAEALGPDAAAARLVAELGLPLESARSYLETVGRGICGWCGGTGRDPAVTTGESECPVCFGRQRCVACGGDRRVKIGEESAHRAYLAYRRRVDDIVWYDHLPTSELAPRREEVRRLTREFAVRHPGTVEVTRVTFWPEWPTSRISVDAARERLDRVLKVLSVE
jgi:hypothetical protein